jgi:small-conductance mechanosensitive channel
MADDTSTTGDNDTGDDGDDNGSSDSTTTTTSTTDTLGPAGEAALKAERQRARQLERDLKAAANKLKAFEDRDKTAAQLLEERAANAEKAAADAQTQLVRYRVAAEKGLPAELAGRLQGANEKELAADADKLLALIAGKPGTTQFNGGPRKTAEGKPDMNALIRGLG